jgi:predicted alpha/beta-fold hydrolase
MYNYYAYNDVLEPMRHAYDIYCEPVKRKCFAVGVSMGANILTNLLGEMGEKCFLDAAFIL